MKKIVALILMMAPALSSAQGYPPEPADSELIDPEREMQRLGWPMGVWRGVVEPLYDPIGMNRLEPEGYKIEITIRNQSAEIVVTELDGSLRRLDEGETYIYNVDNTVLVSYVNWNGAFVEYQSFALAQIEPDKIKGYVSRVVHNVVVPNNSPWRVIPVYALVELDRVQ